MPDFDLIVIGAGAAGLSVTAGAAQLGARVALIERDHMGGDCLNFGCVPSKALLSAAHAARTIRQAARMGVRAADPAVDWDGVRAHVERAIATIAPTDSEERFRGLGATVIKGEARFLDPNTLTVNGTRLTARRFVVAAGSRAAVPAAVSDSGVPYWTNTSLFDLTERPDHLLILGGGPIGLEMADAFAGLGVRVTVAQSRLISPRDDPALVAPLRAALVDHGVTIEENARVMAVEPGPTLVLADGRRIAGSYLLVATGRVPNLEALDSDKAGVTVSGQGVVTDIGLRSVSNRRVFAVGDIADPVGIGPRHFTHVGSYHAGIVIRRALFRLPARVDYAALPRVTFTDPELAQVGLTLAEAGAGAEALDWPMAENDRAIAEGDTTGLTRVVIKGGRVVGAGIVAPHAGEMIGTWTLAVSQRVKLAALAGMIVPYPTRAEGGKRAIGVLFARRLFAERTRRLVRVLLRLG